MSGFAQQIVASHDWGFLWLSVALAAATLLVRRNWRPLTIASAVILPMVVLYAATFAVTTWDQTVLTGDLAPRVLTHLLGPAFFVLAAGLHDLTSLNKPVERAVA